MSRLPVAFVVLVAAAADARAALPQGGDIDFERLLIREGGGDLQPASTAEIEDQYFNLAHCVCSNASQGEEQTFALEMRLVDPGAQYDRPAEVWLGSQCDNDEQRPTTCSREDAATIADIDSLATAISAPEIRLQRLMNPTGSTCEARELEGRMWVLVDTDADGAFDYNVSAGIATDTLAAPTPSEFSASGAEGAIELSWTSPTDRASDLFYFQALCAGPDGLPVKEAPGITARYQTVRQLCGLDQGPTLEPVDIAVEISGPAPDAAPASIPAEMARLDPAYLCGEATGASTSLRIEGLENGVPHTIVLLAIDASGNAAGVSFTQALTPQPVTDFWEDLRERGSQVRGGFCASGDEAGGALLVFVAGVWLWGRRRRAALVVPVAMVLLATGPARAEDWEDAWYDPEGDSPLLDEEVRWHVGVKFGPYTPAIDAQFAEQTGADPDQPGPFEEMFGGNQLVLPTLEVDRFLWHPYGQLGVGGSIGMAGDSAKAFRFGTDPMDPDRPRADKDSTTFRVVPMTATAVYRFTYLDDAWGIPVVPYARAGLAYNVWWIRAPSGEYAMFGNNRATGGTLGVTGSIGLAIRAERVDADAALSMRSSGLTHAGFYAELSMAKVDGFGSDERLALGDNTWFAGINFEF